MKLIDVENELLRSGSNGLFTAGFDWVGYKIDYKDIDNFSEILNTFPEKKHQDYVNYLNRILHNESMTSIELLC